MPNYIPAAQAVQAIKSNHRVFVHGSAATPAHLLNALFARKNELENVELVSITLLGEGLFDESLAGHFFINSLFVSDNVRAIVDGPHGDYVPVFLSEIPRLFADGIMPLDVALIHVSEPDAHGYCSLGTSVDVARAAVQHAKYVIAQVNPQMPRTHGDGVIHINNIHALVAVDEPLPEVSYSSRQTDVCRQIGAHCAALIEDGSTLQMGIGAIPDAVLANLTNHKDLGIHTEMFSDGLLPLVDKGVITNKYKKKHQGVIVSGFVTGTRKLYDFVDDNPLVRLLDIAYVNNPSVILQNPKVVAVNSALEIDLTGQVCADSIGMYQYSGIGGQVDFMRGAAISQGGKPIIAINSIAKNGQSKIVPFLKEGAGVVTTRGHVHYVVTEYGVAYLFGKNLKQRADALVNIAHPNHRDWLERAVFERFSR